MPAIALTTIKNAIHTWFKNASGLTADRVRWAGQNAPEPSNTLHWILLGRFSMTNPGSDWTEYEPNPLVFANKVVTLDAATDTGTSADHDLLTRDGPIRLETTGSLSGTGLAVDTDYWCIKTDANTLQFSESFAAADAGIYIDIQGAGTGVHSIVDTADTRRAGQELKELVRGARRVSFEVQCFPPQPELPELQDDYDDPVSVLSDCVAKAGLGIYASALQDAGIGLLDAGTPTSVGGIQNSVYFEPRATMTVVFSTTSEVEGTETIIDYVNLDEDPGSLDFAVDATTPPESP
jgi:hypothetical protein